MRRFYVERRTVAGRSQRLEDAAYHLELRYSLGVTVVVVERPKVYVSTLAKALKRRGRLLRSESARKLGLDREPYEREMRRAEKLHLAAAGTAKVGAVSDEFAVIFVDPSTLDGLPSVYATVYVVDALIEERRRILEEQLMLHGLLVEYVQK